MLRAIAAGRGQIGSGRTHTIAVDGLWCDFVATNELVSQDLVRPARPAPSGAFAPAILTSSGVATLATFA